VVLAEQNRFCSGGSARTLFAKNESRTLVETAWLHHLKLKHGEWLSSFAFSPYAMARAFAVLAQALGIPALLPFLKAVCQSKKSWQARHTVGRRKFTPILKSPVSALTKYDNLFQLLVSIFNCTPHHGHQDFAADCDLTGVRSAAAP
jgi:hypothetical protein